MLDVDRNRLDYGRLLIPPEGHELRQAVATTYSADLDTLLSIPVALFYSQTLEGDLRSKDVHLIRAIQNTAKMLTIYHQEGQLRVPRSEREIHAYFESSLAPVLPASEFTSFHPKLWVLSYQSIEDPQQSRYRLIVLSRNLTFDRSWDVAVCLEGLPEAKTLDRNKPLVDFLQWLDDKHPFPAAGVFIEELSRVSFEQPAEFDDYQFHPVGVTGYKTNPVARQKSETLLCISPFLHEKTIDDLHRNTESLPVLLSRADELQRLPVATLRQVESYCLSPIIEEGERMDAAEDGQGEPMPQSLHAKLFLFDDASHANWFLGSANATLAACTRNVEFMIQLIGTDSRTRLTHVKQQLLGEDGASGVFEEFLPSQGGQNDETTQSQQRAMRTLEYAILAAQHSGKITPAETGDNYDFHLAVDFTSVRFGDEFQVSVRPFVRFAEPQQVIAGTQNELVFPNISETRISRFLHFVVSDEDGASREFLIRIEVEGMPAGRLDNIFKSIINSSEKFFAYLRFLLTDEPDKEDFGGTNSQSSAGDGDSWEMDIPIFEQLLVVASRNPKRLREIDSAINSLRDEHNEDVIPASFLSLWEVFRAAIPHNEVTDE